MTSCVSTVYLEDSFIKSGVFSVAELVRVSRSEYLFTVQPLSSPIGPLLVSRRGGGGATRFPVLESMLKVHIFTSINHDLTSAGETPFRPESAGGGQRRAVCACRHAMTNQRAGPEPKHSSSSKCQTCSCGAVIPVRPVCAAMTHLCAPVQTRPPDRQDAVSPGSQEKK